MNIIIFIIVFLFNAMLYSSEICINDFGLITKIDSVDIDFDKIGILKYDNALSDNYKIDIENPINAIYVDRTGLDYKIENSKTINDCIIIMCNQPGVSDGGIDIVYSKVSKMILGRYRGGYRG